MKRLIVLALFMLLSSSMYADTPAAAAASVETLPTSDFCEADDCGSLPPSEPPVTAGTQPTQQDPCVKATSYDTCKERCNCQYNEAYKKCGRYAYACKDLAAAEKNACLGMCITDWTY